MKITVQYTGQLAGITGVSEEMVELTDGSTLLSVIKGLGAKYPAEYLDMLMTTDGKLRLSLLVILDGEQAEGDLESLPLDKVQTVMLMTPIAGG